MSAPQKIRYALTLTLPSRSLSSSSRNFLLTHSCSYVALARSLAFTNSVSFPHSIMPQRKSGLQDKKWKEKPKPKQVPPTMECSSAALPEAVTSTLSTMTIAETSRQAQVPVVASRQFDTVQGSKPVWMPKSSYGTVTGPTSSNTAAAQKNSAVLSKLLKGNLLENFTVDNATYTQAQIRATFYPKFENEKSDQEVRLRMIEMVSKGLATMEVSLKHSGSLFMYAGHEGGAYAKNSYGNIYTAVGVFVLGRMFQEAWGTQAMKKQAEFNNYLEKHHMCISMELVTAVLGDHGQRPREDYVVVTAITNLGNGKPKFFSTPEIIAFCREWRLPTNHIWLFSTRKSVTSFFAAYDVLCEEGTATSVCRALDEVADISVSGSIDHIKVQGEILEGLVARIVSPESSKHMDQVLRDYPSPPTEESGIVHGPSLREICAANRSDENQQIKALLQSVGPSFCPDHTDWLGSTEAGDAHARNADRSAVVSKFLEAHPADYSTTKLQEMVRLMKEKRFPAAFKCYHNFHKVDSVSNDNLFYKMVIHVHADSVFRRYQKEMRHKPELWPLYRGFFVDINFFKTNKKAAEFSKERLNTNGNGDASGGIDGLADDDANLMIKMKFLTYKIRTFLIRNGLSILFKDGPGAYKSYYLRQMKIWNTSAGKQKELTKMLDEWAVYLKRKCGNKPLSSATYLTEAEPFLEMYAKRSPENQALIGSAGNLVRTENFLAIVHGGRDEEGDLETEKVIEPTSPIPSIKDTVQKDEGLIVFFPGIPGCAKSALCKELLNSSEGLEDDRPIYSLMGDLIKGKYWQKVAAERKRKPYSIMLADKNAPNEEVWTQIEGMCRNTKAVAVPVVPDCEGTDSNPFSLDALAVFMFRVLQRVNHPGNLDKASPNAGYVLLMFYNLYEGKSRQEFESELVERFGSLVKMPLLKTDRRPMPDELKSTLKEGISLFQLHSKRHGRLESTKGTYVKEWAKWEKQTRDIFFGHAEYLNSIQVPFELAVKQVLEQLKGILKGEYVAPTIERRKLGAIIFAAVSLPVAEIHGLLKNLAEKNSSVKDFLNGKQLENTLKNAHVTLAHKRSHGVTAVANYGSFLHQDVPVELTALLFTDFMAALDARLGSVEGEKVISKNEWPHVTIWTGDGVTAKEANTLPQLLSEGKAKVVEINPPIVISGPLEFY